MGLTTFIFKITSYCNLNCSYCYVFNGADQSYLTKPKVMPISVAQKAVNCISDYAIRNAISHVHIVLHGGEPILAGQTWFRNFAEIVNNVSSATMKITVGMQTNGVGLDSSWLDLLHQLDITFGLSLDGPEHINDRTRVNHAGKGSYRQVLDTLQVIEKHPHGKELFGGILCVIDPSVNGLEIYKHFRRLNINKIDFLLPHDWNWDRTPPYFGTPSTPIADYLIPIFDDWWAENDPSISIRMFEVILSLILGQEQGLDSLGGFPLEEAIIEADGSIEPLDVLRECGNNFTQIGLTAEKNTLEEFMTHPLVKIGLRGREGLCGICKQCALEDICGGGYLPHRYGGGREFDNPSIHCRDLWRLITHMIDCVGKTVRDSTPEEFPA